MLRWKEGDVRVASNDVRNGILSVTFEISLFSLNTDPR